MIDIGLKIFETSRYGDDGIRDRDCSRELHKTLQKRQVCQKSRSAANRMAPNPEAAGAAGLAAAASGAGAGGPADTLDEVRAIFNTLGMTITQRDGIINAHNLTSIDDFDYIRVDDAGSFVKVWNETSRAVAIKVGMPTHQNM